VRMPGPQGVRVRKACGGQVLVQKQGGRRPLAPPSGARPYVEVEAALAFLFNALILVVVPTYAALAAPCHHI